MLPQSGAGKVRTGQRVHIKLDNYPYNEFGLVDGYVETVSQISRENAFLLTVILPEGLTTSFQKKLEFKQEMQGIAEVVTEDLTLIDRLFYQFRSLLMHR